MGLRHMEEYKQEWRKQLVKCIRCGTCRSVCPVFKAADNENTTARGKVRLIEAVTDGRIPLTETMQERMSKCLMCKACVVGCPSGVKTDEIFLSARKALADRNGIPLVKKLAFTGLTYRKLFDLGLRTGAVFQGLVFKTTKDGRGKIPRIPVPGAGMNARRLIPELAKIPLKSMIPTVNKVARPKARVAFFTGCMLNYVYPEAGKAIIEILNKNDVEVVIPPDLHCCGTPAFTSGDFATGAYLAQQNLDVLADQSYDAIITGCGTCGAALQHEYGQLSDTHEFQEKWNKVSSKVYDIAQYLVKFGYKTDFGRLNAKITYHDPCHLIRGMQVSKEPRQILASIPGVEFVEMKDANKCCGAGGTFSMAYYELSRQINDVKLDQAEKTGASVLATGCSACRMHMNDGLSQREGKLEIKHTAEIIAAAYRAGVKGGQ